MATTQRSNGLQNKILMVAVRTHEDGCSVHRFFRLQFLHWTHSSASSQSQVSVPFLKQPWLLLLESVSPIDQYLWSDLPETDVSHVSWQNHSLAGCRHAQELCGSSACSSHRTCFGTWATICGHPLGVAADRKVRIVTSTHRVCKGIQLFSSSQPYYSSFTSTHLLIFSCIECAFHDINFCPHLEHTSSRSLQASC